MVEDKSVYPSEDWQSLHLKLQIAPLEFLSRAFIWRMGSAVWHGMTLVFDPDSLVLLFDNETLCSVIDGFSRLMRSANFGKSSGCEWMIRFEASVMIVVPIMLKTLRTDLDTDILTPRRSPCSRRCNRICGALKACFETARSIATTRRLLALCQSPMRL